MILSHVVVIEKKKKLFKISGLIIFPLLTQNIVYFQIAKTWLNIIKKKESVVGFVILMISLTTV